MFGKTFGLVAVAQRLEAREVFRVERVHGTDRQADPVDRQRIVFTQLRKVGMRKTAGAHVIFRMHLEKTHGLGSLRSPP